MISDERQIETEREEFSSEEEQHIECNVENILWENQRVQTITLIYGALVVRF